MNVLLWTMQGLLAATFAGSGGAKLVMSKDRMIETGQTGVAPFPLPVIRMVAALEIAGAIGLLAPWWTGIAPMLTPVAAVGLAIVMIGAAISHWSLGEYKQVFGVNAVLFVLLMVVAVTRLATLE